MPSDSAKGSSSKQISLLRSDEIALLTNEEFFQYRELLEAAEREEDLEDVANGLTLDLEDFERKAWNIVEPDTPLLWNWHYSYLCEWLTLVANGEFRKQHPEWLGIIINVPPRSGKSTFSTVIFPVWTWLKYRSRRFVFGSHTKSLAQYHNGKRNFLIKSDWFQERFGDRFSIRGGVSLTENNHTGRFQLSSIGGNQTGFGGLIAIGDDLLDRSNKHSVAIKKATNDWIDSSFSKMLDDAVRGTFIHISQRLAVDDPTGHLLGEDMPNSGPDGYAPKKSKWLQIKIRREATEPEEYVFPISGRVVTRNKGDILQADRCPPMVVVNLKSDAFTWANQEQQEPTPATGAIINPNWLKYYRASEALPTMFQVVVSIDCTFKDGDGTDMVAIHKYGLSAKRRILLDRRTERLNYPSTKQAAKEMARGGHRVDWLREPMPAATQLLIENKANGPALTDELRDDPEFGLSIVEYEPGRSSKTERFVTAASDAQAGNCWFPTDAPWIGSLRKTLTDYAGEGSVKFDDDCDAWSQFVNWSRQMQYGLLKWLDKQAEEQAKAEKVPQRCLVEDENGIEVMLELDEVRNLWFDPKNPERTYPPGPDPADAAEGGTEEGPSSDHPEEGS